ncbi:MAG: ABC transporter ATP-binding protein, partial [Clostridia bacterium]|nr:ABC transporter ATP-binding protein [Clostridia bacterium]
MTSVNEKRSLPFFGVGKVLPYMKKYRKTLLIMILCGLMSTGVDLLIPQFQRYSLNHFIGGATLDTLPWFILIYVIAISMTGILNYISCSYAMRTEVCVNRDLRNAAFSHLQTLSFSY